MYKLRPYQEECVKKLMWSKDLPGADVVCLPTGAGKSLIIAELAHRIDAPILILQPSREILEQNVDKMLELVDKSEVGIFSASMGKKEISTYTFATIGSIYKKPELFSHFEYIIIDECHLVNPKDPGSMFMQFIEGSAKLSGGSQTMPKTPVKIVGLTATPYRLDKRYERRSEWCIITHTVTKLINRTKGRFWHRLIFNINVGDLMEQGYLVPLKYIDMSILSHEEIPLNKSKSDFNLEFYEEKIAGDLERILETIFFAEEMGKHVLVFCASVNQAEHLQSLVPGSGVVTAQTPKKDREKLIQGFRLGRYHTVFNVGVLTTGFDFPELDCIVLLRPTKSIGLYYQMLGRGVRISEGKEYCRVFDLTGTVVKLGKIESIRLEKQEKWELLSKENTSWHNVPLYSFMLDPR